MRGSSAAILLVIAGISCVVCAAAPALVVVNAFGQGTGGSLVITATVTNKVEDWKPDQLARAEWTDSYDQLGWSKLKVVSRPGTVDADSAYAAGYAEGYVTVVRIEQHAFNSGAQSYVIPDKLRAFLATNKNFVDSLTNLGPTMPAGMLDRQVSYQAGLISRQHEGLYKGYVDGRAAVDPAQLVFKDGPLPREQFDLLTLGGDMEDLEGLFPDDDLATVPSASPASSAASPLRKQQQKLRRRPRPDEPGWDETRDVTPVYNRGRCSALIRRTANNDLFTSQVTWSSFNSMLRVWKSYDLPHRTEPGAETVIPGFRQAFSSYPGVSYSGDDIYTTSAQLGVLETTIGNDNQQLSKDFISPFSILEWMRNMIANRLANSAPQWHSAFARFCSGTYNNMNVVVDYKLLPPKASQPLVAGTVVVSEQLPGYVITTDVTDRINSMGYFGSYNMGMNPLITRLSGQDASAKAMGDWFTFERHPRALILRDRAPGVQSLADMQQLMRSCDYKTDPHGSQMETCRHLNISNCFPAYTAENCMATRGDLNSANGVYAIGAFGQRNHVATDAKILTRDTVKAVGAYAVCGPPGGRDNADTPDFKFSTSPYANLPHLGIPDVPNFPWNRFDF